MTWSIDTGFGTCRIQLFGRIDEKADFVALADAVRDVQSLIIDLGEITRISSLGIREWRNFLRLLVTKEIILERCAVCFVEQANMIKDFLGHTRVKSILAPYICTVCGREEAVLIPIVNGKASNWQPKCSRCLTPMEFDEDEEQFFQRFR